MAITTSDSEPEPDIAIVLGPLERYIDHHPHPSEIALVVEVAETSLIRDRRKARMYARAGIPHYWIVNLRDRCVEIYSQPEPTRAEPTFAQSHALDVDAIARLQLPEGAIELPVREFLP
jgi:Uma2 family endonuclease